MTRTERWAAIIFFGVALFGAEAVVRAASPPAIACVRNGMTGLLKSGVSHTRQTPDVAPRTHSQTNLPK